MEKLVRSSGLQFRQTPLSKFGRWKYSISDGNPCRHNVEKGCWGKVSGLNECKIFNKKISSIGRFFSNIRRLKYTDNSPAFSPAFYLIYIWCILKNLSYSLIGKKLTLLDCLSLIHTFMESLPHAVLQAGAIVVKTVVNNDQQCFYPKETFERWIKDAYMDKLSSKYAVNDQY